jgi:DNA primase large subunit
MDKGYIKMTQRVLCRVILETLRQRLIIELSEHMCNQAIVDVFLEDIRRLQTQVAMKRKSMKTTPVGKFDITVIPPCLKQILGAIQSGENVPHMGRFALVAFLSSLKLSTQEILQLFSTAPDFEEDKTRYQVEHITGTSSSTAYKSPGCDKLRTYGLCPTEEMDEICKRIQHPLGYYNKKWRQEKKQS